MASCRPRRRAWASSYSRNSRTRPQSRDIHFTSQALSRSESRGGRMKSRIQVSFKTAWVCALTVEHSKVGSARDKRFLMQLVAVLALSPAVWAQQNPAGEDQTAELQKATQNPVANLILVPLQNNTNFGVGPLDRTQNVLNIQPVIPVQVSEKWKLITRTIAPLIYQPDVTQPNLAVTGPADPAVARQPRHLESQPRQRVDGGGWRRHRPDHEVRGAAGEPHCSVLPQCLASGGHVALEHADPARVPVPQAVEGAGKEDAGAKVEAIGATATLGAWTSAVQAAFPLARPDLLNGNGQIISSDCLGGSLLPATAVLVCHQ